MKKEMLYLIVQSWYETKGNVNSLETVLKWVEKNNKHTHVYIQRIIFNSDDVWEYQSKEKGIVHKSNCFFSIKGLVKKENGIKITEQPIIIQEEIGYLGIICKKINGILNFLIQAKIEPGNINKVQISPTLQATKSNFMQVHGGKKPPYLEYFFNKSKYVVLVDQIQSEYSSYFMGKRNRNIIIVVDEEIEITPNHMWVTLGQIKELMKIDNLVNADLRTVISCIPFDLGILNKVELKSIESMFKNKSLLNSMINKDNNSEIIDINQYINDYKMMDTSVRQIVDLCELETWEFNIEKNEFLSLSNGSFKIIYCNIEIDGREVHKWTQPLIETSYINIIALIRCNDNGVMKFLVRTVSELGCLDKIEIGPTVIIASDEIELNDVESFFLEKYKNKENIIFDSMFSEEGGRFYNGQNRNVIIDIDKNALQLPKFKGYFWIDFYCLNQLIQNSNYINIHLRNLFAIIEL